MKVLCQVSAALTVAVAQDDVKIDFDMVANEEITTDDFKPEDIQNLENIPQGMSQEDWKDMENVNGDGSKEDEKFELDDVANSGFNTGDFKPDDPQNLENNPQGMAQEDWKDDMQNMNGDGSKDVKDVVSGMSDKDCEGMLEPCYVADGFNCNMQCLGTAASIAFKCPMDMVMPLVDKCSKELGIMPSDAEDLSDVSTLSEEECGQKLGESCAAVVMTGNCDDRKCVEGAMPLLIPCRDTITSMEEMYMGFAQICQDLPRMEDVMSLIKVLSGEEMTIFDGEMGGKPTDMFTDMTPGMDMDMNENKEIIYLTSEENEECEEKFGEVQRKCEDNEFGTLRCSACLSDLEALPEKCRKYHGESKIYLEQCTPNGCGGDYEDSKQPLFNACSDDPSSGDCKEACEAFVDGVEKTHSKCTAWKTQTDVKWIKNNFKCDNTCFRRGFSMWAFGCLRKMAEDTCDGNCYEKAQQYWSDCGADADLNGEMNTEISREFQMCEESKCTSKAEECRDGDLCQCDLEGLQEACPVSDGIHSYYFKAEIGRMAKGKEMCKRCHRTELRRFTDLGLSPVWCGEVIASAWAEVM